MSVEKQLLQNQAAAEGRENLDWILYDSLLTTAGATQQLTFFQNTVGGVGRERTNLKNAGMLPAPQSFFITKLCCKIFNLSGNSFFTAGAGAGAATEYPLNAFFSQGHFDFVLDPRTEYEGHMMQLNEQINRVNDSTAALLTAAALPGSFTYSTLSFNKPIIVAANRAFSLRMTVTTPAVGGGYLAADTVIMWFLKGVLRRNQ